MYLKTEVLEGVNTLVVKYDFRWIAKWKEVFDKEWFPVADEERGQYGYVRFITKPRKQKDLMHLYIEFTKSLTPQSQYQICYCKHCQSFTIYDQENLYYVCGNHSSVTAKAIELNQALIQLLDNTNLSELLAHGMV